MSLSRIKLSFFSINSLIGSFIIYFLVSTLVLRIFYFILFFFFSLFIQIYLFSNSFCNISLGNRFSNLSNLRKVLTSAYGWGIFASIFVLITPNYTFTIYSDSVFHSLLSLSPIVLLRIISGVFILTFLPGKALYDSVIKKYHNFDFFEQAGFVIAISWILSTILGLILLRIFDVISPLSLLASIWLFVSPLIVYKFVKEGTLKKAQNAEVNDCRNVNYAKWGILLSLGIILLFSSYLIHMVSQPLSGIYSGDLLFYFKSGNEFVNFGSTVSPYLWFQLFIEITSSITGLPQLYSLACLQFFVLLVPLAFYIMVKNLFPNYQKAPILTAVFVFLQGLAALPVAIVLITQPAVYSQYMSGNVMSVLTSYFSGVGSGVSCWISAFVGMTEIAIGALAFTFTYCYFKKGRLSDLLLGSIFLMTTLFLHGIFFLPLFFLVLTIFLLLQKMEGASKKLTLFIVISSIFLFGFDFLDGFHFLISGNQTSSYFLMIFWPLLPILILIIHFKDKLFTNKLQQFSHNWTLPMVAKKRLSMIKEKGFLFWLSSLVILFVPIVLSVLTWGERLSAMRNPFLPWFVYIICFGFPLAISIAGLPLLFRTTEKNGTLFIVCWLLSLILLGLSGPYLLGKIFPSLTGSDFIFNRFLQQIVYLTSSLGALVLSVYWSEKKNENEASNHKTKSQFSKFRVSKKLAPILFVGLVIFSFLYMPYGAEYYLIAGTTSNHVDVEMVNLVNANISSNSVILPLSDQSYTELCALTQLRVMPPNVVINVLNGQSYSDQKSAQTFLYSALRSLNIVYVYETPSTNLTSLGLNNQEAILFMSVLSTFRVIYQNNNNTLYEVTYNN